MMINKVVTWDRLASFTTPVAKPTPMNTITAAATAAARPNAWPDNGCGTVRPCSPRLRRKITYWVSPSAIYRPRRHRSRSGTRSGSAAVR